MTTNEEMRIGMSKGAKDEMEENLALNHLQEKIHFIKCDPVTEYQLQELKKFGKSLGYTSNNAIFAMGINELFQRADFQRRKKLYSIKSNGNNLDATIF